MATEDNAPEATTDGVDVPAVVEDTTPAPKSSKKSANTTPAVDTTPAVEEPAEPEATPAVEEPAPVVAEEPAPVSDSPEPFVLSEPTHTMGGRVYKYHGQGIAISG